MQRLVGRSAPRGQRSISQNGVQPIMVFDEGHVQCQMENKSRELGKLAQGRERGGRRRRAQKVGAAVQWSAHQCRY